MLKCLRQSGLTVLLLLVSRALSAQVTTEAALLHLQKRMSECQWQTEELATLRLESWHRSQVSGLHHFYFRQAAGEIPLLPGWASIHLDDAGHVVHENIQLVSQLAEKLPNNAPVISPEEVLLQFIKQSMPDQPVLVKNKGTEGQAKLLSCELRDHPAFTVPAQLVYQQDQQGELQLCWNLVVPVGADVWDVCVDAVTGEEISRQNWVHLCRFHSPSSCSLNEKENKHALPDFNSHSTDFELTDTDHFLRPSSALSFNGKYRVFAMPAESPNLGTRSLKNGADIVDATASPFGWHDVDAVAPSPDYGYTRGNNVYAYYAPVGTSSFDPAPVAITRSSGLYAGGNVPWPGNLEFDYDHSLNALTGTAFIEDAVTNLFVWNNICHDVFYLFGFDEAAGNFQEKNPTGQGVEGDYVRARAQDGSGLNNAAFFTPPEPAPPGTNPPYMRMFLWDQALPDSILDGDFDNAIIAHEYGHGVSNRLVGGAATNACLTNFEQGGEGWSDFFGLLLTMADYDHSGTIEKTKLGEGIRSIGAYVLGNEANEEGVRPAYYSYDMNCPSAHCNDFTYGDVPNVAVPHGVGFVWCTMLWDMTLDLIGAFGFEENIYSVPANVAQHKGNTRAMNLVIEGLKLTPCNPTFPQMRDAILDADTAIYGSANSNLIWAAFSRRGLGFSAMAGGVEAFDNPTMLVTKTVDQSQAEIGDLLTYTITVKNNSQASLTNVEITDPVPDNLEVTFVSDGGSVQNKVVVFPTVAEIPVGQSVVRSFQAEVSSLTWTTLEYDNPVETAVPPDFTPAGAWVVDGGNPNSGSTLSWWHLDPPAIADASLVLTLNLDGGKNNHLSFWQYFDLEPAIDGGVIEVLEGTDWIDAGSKIKQNGYTHIILDQLNTPIGVPIPFTPLSGRRAFSGYSGGYIQSIVDLSGYSGTTLIRFRLASDETNVTGNCNADTPGCDGWYLDDFKLYDLQNIQNTAYATSAQGFNENGNVGEIGTMFFAGGALPVRLTSLEARPAGQHISVDWVTASEHNNQGFELERRGGGSTHFEKIAWIDGQVNSDRPTSYNFLDARVEEGITYQYRLRQIDLSGRWEYSKVVSALILADKQSVGLFPNPLTGNTVFLQLREKAEHYLQLHIYNMQGKLISNITLPGGQSVYPVEIPGLVAGVYLVNVQLGNNMYQTKLVAP